MPEWGLTKATRGHKPFGLDEWWLAPGKVITDPVHGDIFITRLEQAILDTRPMQRLRRVRQLGTTHLVYPGATHTRFSHSLGAVRVVQTLLDVVIGQRDRPHAAPDLFYDWEQEARAATTTEEDGVKLASADDESWRAGFRHKLAEATVLARLGALLHDLGHLPFGHTIEDDLELLPSHDENVGRFDYLWTGIIEDATARTRQRLRNGGLSAKDISERMKALDALRPGGDLYTQLRPLILSKDEHGRPIDAAKAIPDYPFVADMVGNTICADLLDYLERDHAFTGLPISLGTRYLASFYITPSAPKGALYRRRMALLVHRNGRPREDVVTEILKHLRYRYELQERALVHHTKLAADGMVGKMIELWAGGQRKQLNELGDDEVGAGLGKVPTTVRRAHEAALETQELSKAQRTREVVLRWRIEMLFLEHGDDGVVETISALAGNERRAFDAAGRLAEGLRDRRLYRLAANSAGASAAADLNKTFGRAEKRRFLETEAAKHAGIDPGESWKVIVWIPGPDMRLKLAELLVDDGAGIAKFKDRFRRGSDIYEAHKALWQISVFVHPELDKSATRAVLAKLSELMGVSWDTDRLMLGDTPATSPIHYAVVEQLRKSYLDQEVTELVSAMADPVAARGPESPTHEQLRQMAKKVREARNARRSQGAAKKRTGKERSAVKARPDKKKAAAAPRGQVV
jgi:HD superfamily phosphohydrolase